MNEGNKVLDMISSSNYNDHNAFAVGLQDLVMGEVEKSWEPLEGGDENGLPYLTLVEGTQVGVQLQKGEWLYGMNFEESYNDLEQQVKFGYFPADCIKFPVNKNRIYDDDNSINDNNNNNNNNSNNNNSNNNNNNNNSNNNNSYQGGVNTYFSNWTH